jgi:hypothetical protein
LKNKLLHSYGRLLECIRETNSTEGTHLNNMERQAFVGLKHADFTQERARIAVRAAIGRLCHAVAVLTRTRRRWMGSSAIEVDELVEIILKECEIYVRL